MMKDINSLTDDQAVEAAQLAAHRWMERSGPEALLIWQRLERSKGESTTLDSWLLDPQTDVTKAATASRKILTAFRQSAEFQAFAEDAIDRVLQARGHFFDPVSAAILGTLAIGLVLAARIESVGSGGVKFYKGLPPGLEKILRVVSAGAVG